MSFPALRLSCSFYVSFCFSSRRRHTRSPRDWSSDVCSSDPGAKQDKQDNIRCGDINRGAVNPFGTKSQGTDNLIKPKTPVHEWPWHIFTKQAIEQK